MIDIHTAEACKHDRRIVRILAEARQRELDGENPMVVLYETVVKISELQ